MSSTLSALLNRLLVRRHTALLTAIIAAFALRPLLGDSDVGFLGLNLALLLILLLALYTVQADELVGEREFLMVERRRLRLVGWGLALLALIERVAMMVRPTWALYVAGSVGWGTFLCFITWSEWRSILRQKEVTSETVSMAISVYLLLGLSWAFLYAVIVEFDAHAFSFGGSPAPGGSPGASLQVFPVLLYFSLTTLSTIGYGDITPVTLQARFAAVAEGITGQLYLAILVARLVGINLSRRMLP